MALVRMTPPRAARDGVAVNASFILPPYCFFNEQTRAVRMFADRTLSQSAKTVAPTPATAALVAGEFKTALGILMPMIQQAAPDPDLLGEAALCYYRLGDAKTGIRLMQVALDLKPDSAPAWGRLGAISLGHGDSETAQAAFERLLDLRPNSVAALAALNRISPFVGTSGRAQHLKRLAKSRKVPVHERAMALNALGWIAHHDGKPRIAFRHFKESKALATEAYDPKLVETRLMAQKHQSPPDPVSAVLPVRHVFICGMPRSGTTLVDTILSRHPDVASVGESPVLQQLLRRACAGSATGNPWDWQTGMTPEKARALGAAYDLAAGQRLPQMPRVILDKLPFNCFDLGFAQTLLPDARFIVMSRHPLDVGLSNFCTNFHDAHPFSNRLEWIGHMTNTLAASIEDHRGRLGPALRVQSYRRLVETPETQIRALLEHIGLPWHVSCLTPEAGGHSPATASILQVREPINRKGLGKWKVYADQLAPLLAALGGEDAIKRWNATDAAL